MKFSRKFSILLLLLVAGCASVPKFGKNDCYIKKTTQNNYVLFYSLNKHYFELNQFKTLEQAKLAAGNVNK